MSIWRLHNQCWLTMPKNYSYMCKETCFGNHQQWCKEVIRAVLNSFFFTERFHTHQKHKSIKTQPSKSTKSYKQTKIKNALKKDLRGKKSLICLFAFLWFLCAGREENRKKKIENREKSPQCRCTSLSPRN